MSAAWDQRPMVVIANPWQREPVFHALADVSSDGYEQAACGLRSYLDTGFPVWLPRQHAEAFARPCRRCERAMEAAR